MKKAYLLFLFLIQIGRAQTTLVVPTSAFRVCDTDTDLVYTFDLTRKDAEIHSHSSPIYAITYHLTQADANAGTNPILTPTVYQNLSNPQTIYARLTNPNNSSGTYYLTSFSLWVQLPLVANQPPDLKIYQNPNTATAKFDLNLQKSIVVGNQSHVLVTFYTSETDANVDNNAIASSCYTNTSNPQTIWARLAANFDGGCYEIMSFQIEVSGQSNPNAIVDFQDVNFKNKLLQAATTNNIALDVCSQRLKIDENNDGAIQTDELWRVRWLNIPDSNIASLQGIKMFPNLNILICPNNQLQELDLEDMYSIHQVNCGDNLLTALDFSQTSLSVLYCYSNRLESINIKNSILHELAAESPGNWGNNPDLASVCVDADEQGTIETLLSINNYPTGLTTTDCNLLANQAYVRNDFAVFPNPSPGRFFIDAARPIKYMHLVDVNGRTLYSAWINDHHSELDMADFASGIYFLNIETEKGTLTQKLIKQ